MTTSETVIERIRHVHDERGNYIAVSIREMHYELIMRHYEPGQVRRI